MTSIVSVQIRNVGRRIQVFVTYNPDFPIEAKKIGGRFKARSSCWSFHAWAWELVERTLKKVYGENVQMMQWEKPRRRDRAIRPASPYARPRCD